jgi:hypothetical protein
MFSEAGCLEPDHPWIFCGFLERSAAIRTDRRSVTGFCPYVGSVGDTAQRSVGTLPPLAEMDPGRIFDPSPKAQNDRHPFRGVNPPRQQNSRRRARLQRAYGKTCGHNSTAHRIPPFFGTYRIWSPSGRPLNSIFMRSFFRSTSIRSSVALAATRDSSDPSAQSPGLFV